MVDLNPIHLYQRTRDLLRRTRAEVALGAAAGLLIGYVVGFRAESYREQKIPLGFSEVSQIERDAAAAGESLSPMTRYLTSTNDLMMKIFECWNDAHRKFVSLDPIHTFAAELDRRMEPTLKFHHYEIPDFLNALPAEARAARQSILEFTDVQKEIQPVNRTFAATWDDTHIDHYRTETYLDTETYTDGDGISRTRTVMKTRQVYDHTIHSYDYHKHEGERASLALDTALDTHPHLAFTQSMRTTSKTNAEGEYAADVSRDHGGDKTRLSGGEYRQVANTWYSGSTLRVNLPTILSRWGALHRDADDWRQSKRTAHDTSYRTNSPIDSGPAELRVATQALTNGRVLDTAVGEIVDGTRYAESAAPVLDTAIRQLISVELERRPGDADALTEKIMDTAKECYAKNFKAGFDVKRFRWPMVAFSGLLGLIGGALAGFGIDYAGKRFQWWGAESQPRFSRRW